MQAVGQEVRQPAWHILGYSGYVRERGLTLSLISERCPELTNSGGDWSSFPIAPAVVFILRFQSAWSFLPLEVVRAPHGSG